MALKTNGLPGSDDIAGRPDRELRHRASARQLRWPIPAISLVLLGNATAMFFFSFGARQTFLVGWPWLSPPDRLLFLGAVLVGMLTMRVASGEGLSQNLLSRGLGFGSRGAAVTSFIYAVNYIYYFLFEGTIVSHAIAIYFDVPINSVRGIAIFALVGLVTLALVWRGMHAMSFLQSWGFPIFVVLLAWGLIQLVTNHDPVGVSGWDATDPLTFAAMMNALSFANGQMIFQGLMATDYGRFADQQIRYRGTARIMLLELVPMFAVIFLGCFLGGQPLRRALRSGRAVQRSGSRVHVRPSDGTGRRAVRADHPDSHQRHEPLLRLDRAGQRLRGRGPLQARPALVDVPGLVLRGRVLCHERDQPPGDLLCHHRVLTNTWVLVILADYFICRRMLGLGRTEDIEFHESDVPQWNPCGLVALGIAVAVGALGILEVYPIYLASFMAMILGPILHVAFTKPTGGRYYHRSPASSRSTPSEKRSVRPWSCDAFAVRPTSRGAGRTIVGKNSDRPARESQPLHRLPARFGGDALHLAYLTWRMRSRQSRTSARRRTGAGDTRWASTPQES